MKMLSRAIGLFADERTRVLLREGAASHSTSMLVAILFRGHFQRFTLYNPLALMAGCVFMVTLASPWWSALAYHDTHTIQAFAFILKHDLPLGMGTKFVIETPFPAVVFLGCLLAGYALLLFWGSTMAGMRGRLFVAFTGLCMLLYGAGFYGAIWYATNRIGMPVSGYSWIFYEVQVDIHMGFEQAYFVALWAGFACLIFSLIHGLLEIRFYRRGRGNN